MLTLHTLSVCILTILWIVCFHIYGYFYLPLTFYISVVFVSLSVSFRFFVIPIRMLCELNFILCVSECSHSRMCELDKIKESVNVKSICIFVIQKPNLCPVIMYWCVKLENKCEENSILVDKNVGRLVYKQC